jgi:hypothetical protein
MAPNKLDFPQPDGPSTVENVPGLKSTEMSLTASTTRWAVEKQILALRIEISPDRPFIG